MKGLKVRLLLDEISISRVKWFGSERVKSESLWSLWILSTEDSILSPRYPSAGLSLKENVICTRDENSHATIEGKPGSEWHILKHNKERYRVWKVAKATSNSTMHPTLGLWMLNQQVVRISRWSLPWKIARTVVSIDRKRTRGVELIQGYKDIYSPIT